MTTINDISDLARIIREQPEWADTIRTLLLGRELLELPNRFAEFVELTTRNFQLVHERLERLESDMSVVKEDVSGLKTDVSSLKSDMAEVKGRLNTMEGRLNQIDGRLNRIDGRIDNALGSNYEITVLKGITGLAGRLVRKVRVLQGFISGPALEFLDLVDEAEDAGLITEEQHNQVTDLDLVLRGRRKADDAEVYLAAEISITVGDSDILRAAERAAILAIFLDQPVIPAVIGAYIDDARIALAAAQDVSVLLKASE